MKNNAVYDEILRKYDEKLERLTFKIFSDDYLEEHQEVLAKNLLLNIDFTVWAHYIGLALN